MFKKFRLKAQKHRASASADEGDSASGESIKKNRGRFAIETQQRSDRNDLGVSGVKTAIFMDLEGPQPLFYSLFVCKIIEL